MTGFYCDTVEIVESYEVRTYVRLRAAPISQSRQSKPSWHVWHVWALVALRHGKGASTAIDKGTRRCR